MEEQIDSFQELKIFSNIVRRELVRVIGESGSISFSSIKEELELTDGRLYFHLKKIDNYIEKDNQNFYRLNEEGKRVSYQLFHEKESLMTDKPLSEEQDKKIGFLDKIAPSGVFYYILGTKTRSLIELGILGFVICWLFGVTNNYFSSIEAIFGGGAIVNMLLSVAHWLIYITLIVVVLKILKADFSFLELVIGVLIGMIPYILYLIPSGILFAIGTSIPEWGNILLTILFVLCKIWSTIIIAQGITITAKRKSYESIVIASCLILIDYIYLLITI